MLGTTKNSTDQKVYPLKDFLVGWVVERSGLSDHDQVF